VTADVVSWAEANWRLENGALIRLRPWQKATLRAMFPADGTASPFETFLISGPKKSGKTELNGVASSYAAFTFRAPETVYVVANDEMQAQDRVFERIARAVRAMGLVASGEAVVSKSEILFRKTGSKIVAIPADFAGAAGALFGVTSWTELWAFRYEGHVRLWEEMTPVPNRRSMRIVDSYAGFSGDSPLLEPMWERALAGKRLDRKLPIYANGKLWAFVATGEEGQRLCWLGEPAEAAAYYAEQKQTLRPGTYARLHLNQWQSGEEAFIEAESWDACVEPDWRPIGPNEVLWDEDGVREVPLRLSVGVDAAVKHDCSAVVAVAHDGEKVRLVCHKIWTPRPGRKIDLELTIEPYLRHLRKHYRVASISYDPHQMLSIASTLSREGFPMHELPQQTANLTACAQNLWELIEARTLVLYPDKELRQHALNAVAILSPRGWRLDKKKRSHKIDGLAALSFACLDAIERPLRAHIHLPPEQIPMPALSAGMADRIF
jgi:phage terminase large subunit-like protein